VRERGNTFPTVEETVVACPAVVSEKSRGSFEENWARLTGPSLFEGTSGR
jgi:hypothetical protein